MKFIKSREMGTESVIRLIDVSKKFRLFSKRSDRIREALFPFGKIRHESFWALKNINFDIPKGKCVGIMGRNGAGKSTLLEIIASVRKPTRGSVFVEGRVAPLLALGAGFNPEFSGRTNVMLNGIIQGFTRSEMQKRMPVIESYADIGNFFDQPVKYFSSGMFIRLAFAAAINIEPDILLVDEALSVGDAVFQHKCCQSFQDFRDAGKTLLLVSHDIELLHRICDYAAVLEKGALYYSGPIKDAIDRYHGLLHGEGVLDEEKVINKNRLALQPHGINKPTSSYPLYSSKIQSAPISGNAEDNCMNRHSYNRGETRMGDGRASIIDYCVLAADMVDPPVIESGRQVSIFVKLIFRKKLDNVSIGFAVVTKEGIVVSGTNLHLRGDSLLSGKENEIIIVRYDLTASFTGGDYFLNLGCNRITPQRDAFLDIRRAVAHFRIAETRWCTGFAALPSQFTVEWRSSEKGMAK